MKIRPFFASFALIAFVAFAAMAPPIDAKASGFHQFLDANQIMAQSIDDPYASDITHIVAQASFDGTCTFEPASGISLALAAGKPGTFLSLNSRVMASLGGGPLWAYSKPHPSKYL